MNDTTAGPQIAPFGPDDAALIAKLRRFVKATRAAASESGVEDRDTRVRLRASIAERLCDLAELAQPTGIIQIAPLTSQGWHHIRFGNPVPEGDEHVMLSVADYRRALHDRDFQELSVRGAISETARTADELAFWRYQAIFWRAHAYDSRLMSTSPIPEEEETWRTAEHDLEAARVAENRERYSPEAPRDPGAT